MTSGFSFRSPAAAPRAHTAKTSDARPLLPPYSIPRPTASAPAQPCPLPGSAGLDWSSLGFSLLPTKSHVKLEHKGEGWSSPELVESPYITLHIGATSLHYGQSCFEGLKGEGGGRRGVLVLPKLKRSREHCVFNATLAVNPHHSRLGQPSRAKMVPFGSSGPPRTVSVCPCPPLALSCPLCLRQTSSRPSA